MTHTDVVICACAQVGNAADWANEGARPAQSDQARGSRAGITRAPRGSPSRRTRPIAQPVMSRAGS